MYLDLEIQTEISARFEESSEISLPNFLNEEKFKLVSEALKKTNEWKKRGPADQKCYEELEPENSDILRDCVSFLSSDATLLMLSNMTG